MDSDKTLHVMDAFLMNTLNAVKDCRADINRAFERLETTFEQYHKAIQEGKERLKGEGDQLTELEGESNGSLGRD